MENTEEKVSLPKLYVTQNKKGNDVKDICSLLESVHNVKIGEVIFILDGTENSHISKRDELISIIRNKLKYFTCEDYLTKDGDNFLSEEIILFIREKNLKNKDGKCIIKRPVYYKANSSLVLNEHDIDIIQRLV